MPLIWDRIETIQRGFPSRIMLAVSSQLRVSEELLDPDEVPGELYVYKQAIRPKAVLERLEAHGNGSSSRRHNMCAARAIALPPIEHGRPLPTLGLGRSRSKASPCSEGTHQLGGLHFADLLADLVEQRLVDRPLDDKRLPFRSHLSRLHDGRKLLERSLFDLRGDGVALLLQPLRCGGWRRRRWTLPWAPCL